MCRIVLVLLLASCSRFPGSADGDRHFRAGDFERAESAYRNALEHRQGSARLRYNLGTTLLRLERYEEARDQLEAATRSGNRAVRYPAHYNAGNADLKPAFRADVGTDRAAELERAVAHYQRALLLTPGDADAKWNLELALRLLAAAQQSGGGADDSSEGSGGGGGGGGSDQSPSRPDPLPDAASGGGDAPRMSVAEAEQLLAAVEQREREQQRAALRRDQPRGRRIRDW